MRPFLFYTDGIVTRTEYVEEPVAGNMRGLQILLHMRNRTAHGKEKRTATRKHGGRSAGALLLQTRLASNSCKKTSTFSVFFCLTAKVYFPEGLKSQTIQTPQTQRRANKQCLSSPASQKKALTNEWLVLGPRGQDHRRPVVGGSRGFQKPYTKKLTPRAKTRKP